jgi:hypothetical protein
MRAVLVSLAVVGACALAHGDAAPPKPFTSKKLGFSAAFPYTPKETPNETGDGGTVASGNPEDTIAYMISVFTVSDDVLKKKPTAKILADAVRGAADNAKGTLKSQTDIKLAGYPGKAFVIDGEQFNADCRIYLVGNRVFLPMVISQPGLALPMTANAFHEAFKVEYKPARK